jgi:hypothetical protein
MHVTRLSSIVIGDTARCDDRLLEQVTRRCDAEFELHAPASTCAVSCVK